MKKLSFFLLLIFAFSFFYNENVKAAVSAPASDAEGVVLMDAVTGKVLYEKNGSKILAPASTTKIMTALLVLKNCQLSETVTVSKSATEAEGTRIGLVEGEKFTVKDLLYGMLLLSANDCAEALAEHVSGSPAAFADLMNKTARELGAKDTHFVNPSGLYEDDHKTTAYDLSLIMGEVSKNQTFLDITRTPAYEFLDSNLGGQRHWADNKNDLVRKNSKYYYQYALTGKSGYTTPSKHTYTAVAEKDGQKLILSILYSPSKDSYFSEAKTIFEYGFDNFSTVKLYSKGDVLCEYSMGDSDKIPLLATQDIYCTVKKGEENSIKSTVTPEDKDLSDVSFNKGDEILSASLSINNEKAQTVKLAAGIDKSKTLSVISSNVYSGSGLIKKVLITCASVFVLVFMFISRRKRVIKRRKAKAKYNQMVKKKNKYNKRYKYNKKNYF
ncbi:MAG: D-alanyl-D-alanine carboxypeptidase family protein [Clostridiaceae bacterium]